MSHAYDHKATAVDLNPATAHEALVKIGERYWQIRTYFTSELQAGPFTGLTAMSMMLVEVEL